MNHGPGSNSSVGQPQPVAARNPRLDERFAAKPVIAGCTMIKSTTRRHRDRSS
jgi:hypothetical protein